MGVKDSNPKASGPYCFGCFGRDVEAMVPRSDLNVGGRWDSVSFKGVSFSPHRQGV